jgi:folate-binding protein YgfZ
VTQTAVAPPEGSVDTGVPWHFGDPLGEQRALDRGEGWVDLSHRPVIEVAGDDRLTWLHTLTSQHVSELTPDVWTQALILDANGRVEHHLDLIDDGERVLAHLEPGTAEALLDYLQKMVFWSKVEVRRRDDLGVVWRPGPGGMDGADAFSFVARDDVAGTEGPPAGTWAYEALRVAAGRPRLGLDTDHRTIPAEVNWIGTAVHLEKGCYRGQETVARVHNLGKPPRRLVRLHLDGSADRLPVRGDALVLEGRTVGFVGTVVQHHELGPVALGLLKRQVPDDAAVVAKATSVGAASGPPERDTVSGQGDLAPETLPVTIETVVPQRH